MTFGFLHKCGNRQLMLDERIMGTLDSRIRWCMPLFIKWTELPHGMVRFIYTVMWMNPICMHVWITDEVEYSENQTRSISFQHFCARSISAILFLMPRPPLNIYHVVCRNLVEYNEILIKFQCVSQHNLWWEWACARARVRKQFFLSLHCSYSYTIQTWRLDTSCMC